MNLRELLEFAVTAAARCAGAPRETQAPDESPEASRLAGRFCVAAVGWRQELRAHRCLLRATEPGQLPDGIELLVADLLATDCVARLWGAWWWSQEAATSRRSRRQNPAARLADDLRGVRHELLALLVDLGRVDSDLAQRLDRLRRQVDLWSDLLIGPLVARNGAGLFAHRVERSREMGHERIQPVSPRERLPVWEVDLLFVRVMFRRQRLRKGLSAELRLAMLGRLALGEPVSAGGCPLFKNSKLGVDSPEIGE